LDAQGPSLPALTGWSAVDLADAVRLGELHPREVVEEHLARIDELRGLNAIITVDAERALATASRGPRGSLAGVPLLVKDTFDTAGLRTTYGSAIFASHVPTRTAVAVDRLERAGAVVLGKANMHEFAWGLTSQNEHWGDVVNPSAPEATPGGSSGGNAAALRAGLCAAGLGTDTAGSVRVPAACCDVVGFKPTNGSVPTVGCRPLAPSLDTIGPMARSVRDCVAVWRVVADRRAPLDTNVADLRAGVIEDVPAAIRFADLGVDLESVALPDPPNSDFAAILQYEACATHADVYPSRRLELGSDARRQWDAAVTVTAARYGAARLAVERWRAQVGETIDHDFLVLPTLGAARPASDIEEHEIREQLGRFTRLANHLGWAALAIGDFQIMGRSESTVLAAGLAWEAAA
jgi:Asp-tRNA(Asn)/Glu-tRNA(Gln) amidotransferase A subunit family amidase